MKRARSPSRFSDAQLIATSMPRYLAVLLLLGTFLLGPGCHSFSPAPETRWTMINVNPGEAQADCHLIEFPDGKKVLIDVANAADARGTALA